jgi:hypothetical protein
MKIRTLAWQVLTGLVLGIGAAAMGGLLLWQMLVLEVDATTGSFGWLLADIASVFGISWASIVAHELGHLLAGLVGRMRIYHVVLGPLKFVRDGGRFRLRLNWRSTAPGYVIAMPTETQDLRRRMFLYIGAGPLANLLVGALLLWVGLHGNELSLVPRRFGEMTPTLLPWMPQSQPIAWFYFAAVMNLMLFVTSLIPGTFGGVTTDGGQLANLLRGSQAANRQLLILTLSGISNSGVRPRDWDGALIERILTPSDGSAYDVMANLYGYYHALDCGRIEEAGQRLDEAVAIRKLYLAEGHSSILLEAAYFIAFHRHDAEEARIALELAKGGIVEQQTRLRAEAAVLLAEGHCEEAAAKAEAGLKLVSRSIDRGGAIAEEEWLIAIRAECLERMGEAEAPLRAASPS